MKETAGAGPLVGVGSSQYGTYTSHQLSWAERLGDVVVRPELQPADSVLLGAARGQHQNPHVALLSQPGADRQPIDLGQHQIQDHQAESAAAGLSEPGATVCSKCHLEAGAFEIEAHRFGGLGLVFDDEDGGQEFSLTQVRGGLA